MDELVATLINPDAMEFGERWSDMFFNVEAVCYLTGKVDPIVGGQLLAAGSSWTGSGWTTGRAARMVHKATGVAMVEEKLEAYLGSFLFSLSVVFAVDIPKLQLGAHAADAALKFAAAVAKHSGGEGVSSSVSGVAASGLNAKQQKEEEEGEVSEPVLAWEHVREELPGDLQVVLGKHTGGGLSIDPRALMESLPLWKGLKDKAETNNHRLDSQRSQDKTLRSIQQKLLGLLRAYPVVHAAVQDEDIVGLSQQVFGLLLLLEDFVLSERKRASIPGTIAQENVLFSTEDLKISKRREDVNKAPGMDKEKSKRWYFRTPTGPKFFRYKGGGYKGQWGQWRGKGSKGQAYGGRGAYTRPRAAGKESCGILGFEFKESILSRAQSPIARAESPIARVIHSGPKGSKATHSGASLGNDSKERIGFCLHPPLPKVYSMSFLVGGKCNPTDSGTDYKRHFPENKTAFKFVNERAISLRNGDKNGLTDFKRLSKLWSSQKNFCLQIFKRQGTLFLGSHFPNWRGKSKNSG
jgi:hypothetical protein